MPVIRIAFQQLRVELSGARSTACDGLAFSKGVLFFGEIQVSKPAHGFRYKDIFCRLIEKRLVVLDSRFTRVAGLRSWRFRQDRCFQ